MTTDRVKGGYWEQPPSRALATAVDAFWCFTVPATPLEPGRPAFHRVLPDGCTDLIVHFPDASAIGRGGAPRLSLVGPMERFALVPLRPGEVSLGVRLHPGWALSLLGVSPRELRGLNVPAEECDRAFRRLSQRLETSTSLAQAMSLLTEEFSHRGAVATHAPSPRAARALQALRATSGQVRMSVLARALGVSERTLHRDVLDEAGVAPKFLARVLRFQRALSDLRAPGADLSDVAVVRGYADQAHLTREFRELAGVPPTGLVG
ncbi:helix-turn-helix domain-containing protein [Myxococcus sp. K15C18031901]|uniref:helix-turn-helix domain-containing protein n=1 Tax=Myxococcus dinghuensis TaxID=2906761 RepID=UPI0020A7159D|nr:helix-turn-helix domain-containing protein [Myxococcus dinghuensis]MCP3105509.1 helix-turn-helix domain-containing protein [Myxococcus dinghuensis]